MPAIPISTLRQFTCVSSIDDRRRVKLITHRINEVLDGPNKYHILHVIALYGDQLFLDSIIRVRSLKLESRDDNGDTPLLLAAKSTQIDSIMNRRNMIRKFIEAGADINAQDRNLSNVLSLCWR